MGFHKGLVGGAGRRHGEMMVSQARRTDMRCTALVMIASVSCLAAQPAQAKDSVYVSLMGEPFRTNEAGEDPFGQWVKLADEDGDGSISRLEFRADAEAFFANLDTNDDKVIDADEMREYERLAPARTRAAGGGAQARPTAADQTKGPAATEREKGNVAIVADATAPTISRIPKAGPPINVANVPQPVAMADLNIDRRVTLDEFTKTAGRRFATYDLDKDGRLTRRELIR
jgi:hypothetical protein